MGYLLNDNRASGGELREYDTVSCKHCQAIIKLSVGKKKKITYWCGPCSGEICEHCKSTDNGVCIPFMKKLEERLRRQASLRSMGIGG